MKVDQKQIKKQWSKKGFSCGLWVDPPGKEWLDYVHDTDELIMVVEGKLEITIGGETSVPEIGEEIFIPKKTHHDVKNFGATTAKWLYGYN